MTSPSWAQRLGATALVAGALFAVGGCGTDYDGTEARAAEQARETARAVEKTLTEVVLVADPPTGQLLVDAVRQNVPDSYGRIQIFDLSQLDEDEVSLKVAFDGSAESGGGGTYYQFLARLCVEYRVRSGADPGVTVEDTRCSPELLEPTGPTQKADRTIGLED